MTRGMLHACTTNVTYLPRIYLPITTLSRIPYLNQKPLTRKSSPIYFEPTSCPTASPPSRPLTPCASPSTRPWKSGARQAVNWLLCRWSVAPLRARRGLSRSWMGNCESKTLGLRGKKTDDCARHGVGYDYISNDVNGEFMRLDVRSQVK
jgi:hypothetical protein